MRPTGVGPLRGYDRPSRSTDATGFCGQCVVNDAMGNKWRYRVSCSPGDGGDFDFAGIKFVSREAIGILGWRRAAASISSGAGSASACWISRSGRAELFFGFRPEPFRLPPQATLDSSINQLENRVLCRAKRFCE